MSAAPVLIIDNNPAILNLLGRIVQDAGYNVLTAHSPALGIELAQSIRPSIVLLDLMMPELNGNEVCRRLRVDHQLDNTWIIMVTSSDSVTDRKESAESGADYYLVKPIDVDWLLQLIAKCKGETRRSTLSDNAVQTSEDETVQSR